MTDTLKPQVQALLNKYNQPQRTSTADQLICMLCRYFLHHYNTHNQEEEQELVETRNILKGVDAACYYLEQMMRRGIRGVPFGSDNLNSVADQIFALMQKAGQVRPELPKRRKTAKLIG
jgi:hypothetical protein